MNKRVITAGTVLFSLAMMFSISVFAENSDKADTIASEAMTENEGSGKKVYFAGPMFNKGEKDCNLEMATLLEEYGYEVFLPQRDGYEGAMLKDKTEEELIELIFEKDFTEVNEADIVFMNLDGRVPDEGACVELGIAYANGKRCYGFKTDTRSVETVLELNPLISGCMIKIFKNPDGDKLMEELRAYLSENDL